MSYLTVKAEDVRIGDGLYMGTEFAKNPNHRYADVKKAKRLNGSTHVYIKIVAAGKERWYNPGDLVEIQRFE